MNTSLRSPSALRPLFLAAFASLTLASFLATACSSSTTPPALDASPGPTASATSTGSTTPPTSPDGAYTGTFSGDDKGPVTMTVAGTNVDVVVTVGGKQYPASGSLDTTGAIDVGIGVGSGVIVTFAGTFASGKGSGTWKSSAGGKGTWAVARQ